MADLIEYVRWRGDLSFLERPFNEIDNLVLSQISYHAFDGIVPAPGQGAVTLRKAADRFFEDPRRGAIPGQDQTRNNEFLCAAAGSRRFGSALMSDYVNEIEDEPDARRTQFCAVCFSLEDASRYIAFRGTDDTVVGWREDFMIAYTVTHAQKRAAEYVAGLLEKDLKAAACVPERVIREAEALAAVSAGMSCRAGKEQPAEPGLYSGSTAASEKQELVSTYSFRSRNRAWRIGGHSKGGNLAAYAAAGLRQDLLEMVCGVYSNDGPGLSPQVLGSFAEHALDRLKGKYHKIVPAYDIIGMLFEPGNVRENPLSCSDWLTVVGSSEKGIMQHWALSWQVCTDCFERRDRLEDGALKQGSILDRWVTSASFDEREAFISTVFNTMDRLGPNMSDVLNSKVSDQTVIITELLKGNSETRSAVNKFFQSLNEENRINLENAVNAAGEALKKLTDGLAELNSQKNSGNRKENRSVLQAERNPLRALSTKPKK